MYEEELQERLAHEEFMDELRKLQEQIFFAWLDRPVLDLVTEHYDIRKFGTEPVFASIIFDRMIEENELRK